MSYCMLETAADIEQNTVPPQGLDSLAGVQTMKPVIKICWVIPKELKTMY